MKKLLLSAAVLVAGVATYAVAGGSSLLPSKAKSSAPAVETVKTTVASDALTIDIDRTNWSINPCSEHSEGPIGCMIDDDLSTFSHQNWRADIEAGHWYKIDMGEAQDVDGFKYWRRQGRVNGQWLAGKIYVSEEEFPVFVDHSDAQAYVDDSANVPAGEFTFTYDENPDEVRTCYFDKTAHGRYLLIHLSEAGGDANGMHACCAEFKAFYKNKDVTDPYAVWASGIEANKTAAEAYAALGAQLGVDMPSAEAPADLTLDNVGAQLDAANAALKNYVTSFNGKKIFIQHALRRSNGYLTALATGTEIKMIPVAEATPDAMWMIKSVEGGFRLYSPTTGYYLGADQKACVDSVAETYVSVKCTVDGTDYLGFGKKSDSQYLNCDNKAENPLVAYSVLADAGSAWRAVAASAELGNYAEAEASTVEAPKYYRLVNARWMNLNPKQPNLGVARDESGANLEVLSRFGADAPGIYWYVVEDGDGVKLVNALGTVLDANAETWATGTEAGLTVYLIKQEDDQFEGYNVYGISNDAAGTNSSYLDASNFVSESGVAKFCWNPTSEGKGNGNNGSAWYLIPATSEQVAAALASLESNAVGSIKVDNGATVIYDLYGRRLSAPVKGINIINGKKVIIK